MALTAHATTSTASVACLLLALAASAAGAGSPAPAPAVDCLAAAAGLTDCLDYVTPGSTSRRPNKACCGKVKAAVANPAVVDCLCSAFSSKNIPIPIDMARVLALPGTCGASNAAFSKCYIAAGPPTEAPSPSAGAPTSGGATAAPSPSAGAPTSGGATAAPSPSAGAPTSGGATAAPPVPAAAASSPITATALIATVAAPLLAYHYLF